MNFHAFESLNPIYNFCLILESVASFYILMDPEPELKLFIQF